MSPGQSRREPTARQAAGRERLLEAAIRLLADEGPEALQARRLAAEVGASTMAVYTYFGGMPQLIEAIAREGFVRFGRHLSAVEPGEDPVADLFELGLAYRDHALENPQLYRLMFGVTAAGGLLSPSHDMTDGNALARLPEGRATFDRLTAALTRMIESGRIRPADPVQVAFQVWSAIHGYVLLEIAGYFGDGRKAVTEVWLPLAVTLIAGLGDDLEAASASARAARAARAGLARRGRLP